MQGHFPEQTTHDVANDMCQDSVWLLEKKAESISSLYRFVRFCKPKSACP